MSNKVFFAETSLGTFVRNKKIHIKNNFWANEQYNEIDNFCYKICEGIASIIDGQTEVLKKNCLKKNLMNSQKNRG